MSNACFLVMLFKISEYKKVRKKTVGINHITVYKNDIVLSISKGYWHDLLYTT